uniref:Uncharacterized protein n=1 Tax=Vespula pensylvanica TaxID=30213 RepID=A0A834KJG2_VESPE|nr:hypothetical protein H0235_013971 [Vespula pensylvanica]
MSNLYAIKIPMIDAVVRDLNERSVPCSGGPYINQCPTIDRQARSSVRCSSSGNATVLESGCLLDDAITFYIKSRGNDINQQISRRHDSYIGGNEQASPYHHHHHHHRHHHYYHHQQRQQQIVVSFYIASRFYLNELQVGSKMDSSLAKCMHDGRGVRGEEEEEEEEVEKKEKKDEKDLSFPTSFSTYFSSSCEDTPSEKRTPFMLLELERDETSSKFIGDIALPYLHHELFSKSTF